MNKLTYVMLAAVCVSPLAGCQKALDYFRQGDIEDPPDCRVISVTQEDEFGATSIHTVTYNSLGNPSAVIEYYNDGQGFEFEDFNEHVYDSQNRLIEEGPFSTPSPYLRKYAYEGNSLLPARDTFFVLGFVFIEDFTYDAQGRIVQEVTRIFFNPDGDDVEVPDEVHKYYYDLRGNRQEDPSNPGYPGLIQYSDKPSLYSLNRTWQVRYRNFSKNATMNGETFNDQGLPLTFKKQRRGYFETFLNAWPGASVVYACD